MRRTIEKGAFLNQDGVKLGGCATLLLFVVFAGWLAGWPAYKVYSQEAAGRAMLAEAQSTRQVAVLEARAKLESARLLADAEVLRAEGAARANRILQDSLGGPEGYLRYLQIQAIDAKDANVIYVPTESGLPITEASRLLGAPARAAED
ncbi:MULTISPECIES: membrane protease subunit [Sphingomonas]|uniref:membrane protease subunit n=1 Tax=Sphingomonas TaxID=13687 RepID=UPI001F4979DC|nr:membrane protease subunit [Sphingomonas sp. ABOLF]